MRALRLCLLLLTSGLCPLVSSSCTVNVGADGSKSATVDAPSAIRVIEIIATK